MHVFHGSETTGHIEERADVVIIGSGAGGAVVAKELAEAGFEVVVLEEGPHVPNSTYGKLRPSETLRTLGREGGIVPVLGLGDSPLITVMAGRAVGGSSLLTGGVCFRVPESIHERWVNIHGLRELSAKHLEPAFEEVERESHVETVPEHMRSLSTRKFISGAERLGIAIKSLRRNTKDCCGCSRCNFGCPHGAKLSVDLTYLPKAIARGARVYSDCLVTEIVSAGNRVSGVRGILLSKHDGTKQRKHAKLFVHANTVVLAAGSLHSPQLLMQSGFRSPHIGRHLTLHPGFRAVAGFDEEIKGWNGALQSAYSDHFEKEGITLVSVFVPPNILAAAIPGVGQSYAKKVADIRHAAIFGGMVHDLGGGRVHRGIGREPIVTYRLSKQDKAGMIRGIQILVECFLEAGAKEVHLPIFGLDAITEPAQIRNVITENLKARNIECVAFHPLGSCRMSHDPSKGVVDPWGQTHELQGLYLADGSIVPTSIGVNSQLTIMAMATRIAWRLRETCGKRPRPNLSAAH